MLYKMILRVISITLSILLVWDPLWINAHPFESPQAVNGTNTALQGIQDATNIYENMINALNAQGCSYNATGQNVSIPLCNEAHTFQNMMRTNVTDWLNGTYSPSDAGKNITKYFLSTDPGNYTANMTGTDKSVWGEHEAYLGLNASVPPYGPEAYANNDTLWHSYKNLWEGNNTYLVDLSSSLNCTETVQVNCDNKTATRCYEDSCFGYQPTDSAYCSIYYDENGVIQNSCTPYESCYLLNEECVSQGAECENAPCYPNCVLPSANGGNITDCCMVVRDYFCMKCNSGTPDYNWTQCPPAWQTHLGLCKACLVSTATPQPAWQELASYTQPEANATGGNATFSLDLTGFDRFLFFWNNVDERGFLCRDGKLILYSDPTSPYYYSNWSTAPSCGTKPTTKDVYDYTGNADVTTPMLSSGVSNITLGVVNLYGQTNGQVILRGRKCPSGTHLIPGPDICCPNGFTFNTDRGRCEYHEEANVIVTGGWDECDSFRNDPDCSLIGTTCLRDDSGNLVVDDLGNCYIEEQRYRCCKELGGYKECTSTSQLNCAGVHCIGYQCRPEDFGNRSGNFSKVTKTADIMEEAAFSDGNVSECEVKKWMAWSVNCCDIGQDMGVTAMSYLTLGYKGYDLYKRIKKYLERQQTMLVETFGSESNIGTVYDNFNQMCVEDSNLPQILAKAPDQGAMNPGTGANGFSFLPSPMNQTFQVMDILGYLADPSPKHVLKGLVSDQTFRTFIWKVSGEQMQFVATKLFGKEAAEELAKFFTGTYTGILATAMSVIGIALTVWSIASFIAGLILGGCSEENAKLNAKKQMGLCHYIGAYKKGSGLFSKKSKFKVYCCYRSPIARKIVEEVRKQIGGWGTPQQPNCGGITVNDLQYVNWDQIDMGEIKYYKQHSDWGLSEQDIIQAGEQGNYGVRYVTTPDSNSSAVKLEKTWSNLNDVGDRAFKKANVLLGNGAFSVP